MKRSSRLSRGADIDRVRQAGRNYAHKTFVLGILANQHNVNRIAVIAGKSVGNAVHRNLAKRRLRSAWSSFEEQAVPGYDLVLIARKPLLEVPYSDLTSALHTLLTRAGLLRDQKFD